MTAAFLPRAIRDCCVSRLKPVVLSTAGTEKLVGPQITGITLPAISAAVRPTSWLCLLEPRGLDHDDHALFHRHGQIDFYLKRQLLLRHPLLKPNTTVFFASASLRVPNF